MPFIVTTKLPDKWREEEDVILSRVAVATLPEARALIAERINALSLPNLHPAIVQYDCLDDPDYGGSVGSFPDGTRIDVEPIELRALREAAGLPPHPGGYFPAKVIAAYNAAQG